MQQLVYTMINNKSVKKILKWFVITYIAIATLIGTAVIGTFIFYPIILMGYNHFAPAPMPVLLPNGFYWNGDGSVADQEHKEIIAPKVKYIMWYQEWVYGYRKGPAYEKYYFICKYGDDCTKSQHLNDIEFKQKLKEYSLPDFDGEKMKDYSELLDEQNAKGIDTSYGL